MFGNFKSEFFLNFLLLSVTLILIVGPGCTGEPVAPNTEDLADVKNLALIPGKGAGELQFGETKEAVKEKLGSPSYEDSRLLAYTNASVCVWLSKKDQRVLRITAGSIESEEQATRFGGSINNSVKIGSFRSNILSILGVPDTTEAQPAGGFENLETISYRQLGLQITLKNGSAVFFLMDRPKNQ